MTEILVSFVADNKRILGVPPLGHLTSPRRSIRLYNLAYINSFMFIGLDPIWIHKEGIYVYWIGSNIDT